LTIIKETDMNREQKIAKLKKIQAGNIKPLDDETLTWDLIDGIYHCGHHKYNHLKLNREQLTAFTEKYGGNHILFESFTDPRDEPIKDESPNDRAFVWKEVKVYETEQPKIDQQPKLEESESITIKPVIQQPKKLKKERKQKAPKVNPVEARKAKLKADHQKVLAQIEQDQQRIEGMNNYKRINREFI
jgi:hypothetical protein